jgi:hypothetical protein
MEDIKRNRRSIKVIKEDVIKINKREPSDKELYELVNIINDNQKKTKENLSLFKTTDDQRVRLYEIANSMKQYGLDIRFISSAVKLAEVYEGAFDLFCLWLEEPVENERTNIVSDLQNEIEELRKDSSK